MYKVKKLFVKYTTEFGDNFLIDKNVYQVFEFELSEIEEAYSDHNIEELYCGQIENLLDMFGARLLEGEPYLVCFEEDLESHRK